MPRRSDRRRGGHFLAAVALALGVFGAAADEGATADTRLLSYLVECALPEGVEVELPSEDGPLRLAGRLGLAPGWSERPLTDVEQRWLSACLLARTNRFGKRVEIAMRAAPPAPAALSPGANDRAEFPVFEGGFFGNLFAERPTAFVCGPDRSSGAAFELGDRLCTLRQDGESLTECGFTHVGPCGPAEGLSVVYVFLRRAT